MADVTDLFKALPYGMFDKRTWSPKARDDFARQLAEEEAQRQLHGKITLQGMADSAATERQQLYLQRQHDLAQQAKDAEKNDIKKAIGRVAKGIVQGNWEKDKPWNAEEADALGAQLAEQMAAEWESAAAMKASREALNDIRGAGVERDIAPYVAKGAVEQAKLNALKAGTNLDNFQAENKAHLAEVAANEAVSGLKKDQPMLGIGGMLPMITGLLNSQARQPGVEAKAARDTAEAGLAEQKAEGVGLQNKLKKDLQPKSKPMGFKIVNGNVVMDAPAEAPVTVNTTQPAGSGAPQLDAAISKILEGFNRPKQQ